MVIAGKITRLKAKLLPTTPAFEGSYTAYSECVCSATALLTGHGATARMPLEYHWLNYVAFRL